MTIALAAVGAALATLLVTLLVLWARQRGRKPEAELTDALRELEARMDAMVRELTDTIERTQHEGQRTRMLGELAGSIDLDEVLNRVLEAAGAVDGVDAALVTVAAPPGGEPIVATLGLSADGGRAPGRARAARRTRGPRDLDVVRVRAGRRGCRRRGRSAPASPSRCPERRHSSGCSRSSRARSTRGSARRRSRSSRSSRCAPARRSRTRGASARRASSPTSTR